MGDSRRRASAPGVLFVPLGAAFAAFCFFLPYVRLLRVFGASVELSGPRIGGGLWLVPAAAAAILLAHFGLPGPARRRLRRVVVACCAAAGLLLLAAVVLRLHHRTGFLGIHFSAATFGVRPAFGWAGSVAGFALVLLAALCERAPRGRA